jgi:hypothetical protein
VTLRLPGPSTEVAEAPRRLLPVLDVLVVREPSRARGASRLVRGDLEVGRDAPSRPGSAPPAGLGRPARRVHEARP